MPGCPVSFGGAVCWRAVAAAAGEALAEAAGEALVDAAGEALVDAGGAALVDAGGAALAEAAGEGCGEAEGDELGEANADALELAAAETLGAADDVAAGGLESEAPLLPDFRSWLTFLGTTVLPTTETLPVCPSWLMTQTRLVLLFSTTARCASEICPGCEAGWGGFAAVAGFAAAVPTVADLAAAASG
jgi:hypothetical protein